LSDPGHESEETAVRIIIEDILTVTMNDDNDIDVFTIVIDGGRFTSVLNGPEAARLKRGAQDVRIPGAGRVAVPGFINGHIHADVTLARGLGDGLTLYEQDNDSRVSRRKWFRDELDAEARYYSKLLQYTEAVKGGTVFICDVPFWFYGDDIVDPFRKVGLTGAVVLDYRKNFLTGEPIPRKEYLEAAVRLRDAGIIPIVEGPSEESYDTSILHSIGRTAQELDTLVQMHLAETTWRVDRIKKKFGFTPVRYLHEIGFLKSNVIGAHGIYIEEEEITVLRESGARIVNCPVAEMKISDGVAPIPGLIAQGVPVGVGTDGALWNDCADMFSEIKSLMLLQRVTGGVRALDAYTSLHAATRGGARVFGLESELGSIEPGKRACVSLVDFMRPHLVPLYSGSCSNVIQNIVSCARASDVDTVIVDGRIVVQGGKLTTIDEDRLVRRCQELGSTRFKSLI
jgi:5-methylthioadenosine/S-adenosylhomocysteine deaminase